MILTPYSIPTKLIAEPLFELIRTETIKYAVLYRKENFKNILFCY